LSGFRGEAQLHIYALYQELTGKNADHVEIYELDEGKRKPRAVDDDFIDDVKTRSKPRRGSPTGWHSNPQRKPKEMRRL